MSHSFGHTGAIENRYQSADSKNTAVLTQRSVFPSSGGDEEFGRDLAQAILVSHLEMIGQALDFLGVPHENGFFAKDMDPKPYFTEGWEDRVFDKFRAVYSEPLVLFYINHLRWELLGATEPYRPVSPSAA